MHFALNQRLQKWG